MGVMVVLLRTQSEMQIVSRIDLPIASQIAMMPQVAAIQPPAFRSMTVNWAAALRNIGTLSWNFIECA